MLRRWRRLTSSRRRARLKSKQQPMTPCSSPVREVSGQEGYPESTATPEHKQQPQQQQQLEEIDGFGRVDRPANQPPIHGEVDNAVAELERLSLDIDTLTKGKSDVVEAANEADEGRKAVGPESPVPHLDDSEAGSQSSSEDSWDPFPSSGSNSTDSSSDAEGEEEEEEGSAPGMAALPSPETTFKFHEEFGGCDVVDEIDGPMSPLGEDFTMGEDGEDAPYPIDTGPWTSRAIPKWAFLRSSNSLPVLGLGPEDFYHGGSALRHEVSPEEVEEMHEGHSDDDGESSSGQHEIATVETVYL